MIKGFHRHLFPQHMGLYYIILLYLRNSMVGCNQLNYRSAGEIFLQFNFNQYHPSPYHQRAAFYHQDLPEFHRISCPSKV